MTKRIVTAILGVLFVTAVAHAQTVLVIPARPADSEVLTSMPDFCSERDVNCVLDDGAPRRAVVGASISRIPTTTPTATGTAAGTTPVGGPAAAPGGNGSSGFATRR